MTAESLSRIQFALTASFHFIFPPISMGLGLVLIVFGVQSVRTKDPKWRRLAVFWVKVYGIVFSMGVATGIVQEFEFGTNWSEYSRFVGNVFGSLLAAEGVFAFMLEGGFLGLMLFGGSRLGPKMWLFATSMVVGGAHFSALWIIMANSWMQTPAGYEVRQGTFGQQAFMTSFADVVFTPSFLPRILHVWVASWMVGATFVMSVAAFYLLKGRHVEISKTMIRVALPLFVVLSVLQVVAFGASQATEVASNQPEKLAAMEGVFQTQQCAPMYLAGWVNESDQTTTGVSIPCLLSLLVAQNPDATVTGLNAFPQSDWAPLNLVFQVYHLMINLGMLFIAIGVVAAVLFFWKRKLWSARWMLWILAVSIVLTELATQSGWWTAEFGRQPWVVWQVMRTAQAESPTVSAGQVWFSIGMFVVLYAGLFGVFLFLLNKVIRTGPAPLDEEDAEEARSLPDSFGEIFRRRSRVSSVTG
ncbi:MAG: cytochrome ubiquinol oxidase subunit I [Acidimicrobiales bacterium]